MKNKIILLLIFLINYAQAQNTNKPILHGKHWIAITGKPLGATAGAMIFNKGELIAISAALLALFSPDAIAEPITAVPAFLITVLTSSKSTLIFPVEVIISAILLAAVYKT